MQSNTLQRCEGRRIVFEESIGKTKRALCSSFIGRMACIAVISPKHRISHTIPSSDKQKNMDVCFC